MAALNPLCGLALVSRVRSAAATRVRPRPCYSLADRRVRPLPCCSLADRRGILRRAVAEIDVGLIPWYMHIDNKEVVISFADFACVALFVAAAVAVAVVIADVVSKLRD